MKKTLILFVIMLLVSCDGSNDEKKEKKEPKKTTQTSVEKVKKSIEKKSEPSKEVSEIPEPVINLPDLNKKIILDIEVHNTKTGKPIVKGITNLPDGTEIGVTVRSKLPGFQGGKSSIVKNNRFEVGPFSSGESELPVGQYIAEVGTPIAEIQPDAVKAVIGKHGEKLKGKLVKKNKIGVTVETKKAFFIGSDLKTATMQEKKRVKKEKAEVKKIYKSLNAFLRKGGVLKRLRNSNMVKCGKLMRQYQPQVKQLRERVEHLTNDYFNLKIAAGNMNLCVSCSKSLADQFCKQAKEALKHAKKEIR